MACVHDWIEGDDLLLGDITEFVCTLCNDRKYMNDDAAHCRVCGRMTGPNGKQPDGKGLCAAHSASRA